MPERYRGIWKLIEEMGELTTELGKLGPFPDGDHPDGKGNLIERIENECADVIAAIRYFRDTNELNPRIDRVRHKYSLFKKWGLSGISVNGKET